ncbi:hypothetical protein BgAZ_401950 [Babesia gibsoni]|uniref:Uncharacterized protein n=1 Tax=Babesia gibsoni TaxID=33632 RepID=A0AAD8LRC6_BABGI|nr:hypothetical protein BgAZ_401950 [Babesia gibsoni]
MEPSVRKTKSSRNSRALGGFKNRANKDRKDKNEEAFNSSSSTSPGSTHIVEAPYANGYASAWGLNDNCNYLSSSCSDMVYGKECRTPDSADNMVTYEYTKTMGAATPEPQQKRGGNVVSLADGAFPISHNVGGDSLVSTHYDDSSISAGSKTRSYETDVTKNVASVSSFVSSSDGVSDTTIGAAAQSLSDTNSANDSQSVQCCINTLTECKICKHPFKHEVILPMHTHWLKDDIMSKQYLQDEFPALPGQVEREMYASRCRQFGVPATSSSLQPEAPWSCVETHALLKAVASSLLSTEKAFSKLICTITPSTSCRSTKMYLFNSIKSFLLSSLGEDTKVFLAGSTAYDIDIDYSKMLAINAYSDIDIEVVSSRFGYNSRAILRKVYRDIDEMRSTLRGIGLVSNGIIGSSTLKLVDSARVPIVIMKTRNGLLCDISANTVNSLSHNELFRRYIDKHPILRSFMRLIKHWLKFRGIPVMKEGGFPSILWMLLFCNVVDTNSFNGNANKGLKSKLSGIFEMLYSKNILGDSLSPVESETEDLFSCLNIVTSLERSFKVLAYGTNLIEMVNMVNSRGVSKNPECVNVDSRWAMGDICANLINLIDMEPSVPYATWLVYYYELYRAEERMATYVNYLEMLVSLIICLRAQVALSSTGNHKTYLSQLKTLIANVKDLLGYDMSYLVREGQTVAANIKNQVKNVAQVLGVSVDTNSSQMMENIRLMIKQITQMLNDIPMEIFQSSLDKVYSIPSSIEPPSPLMIPQEKNCVQNPWSTDNILEGTIWNDNGWYIVSIECKLYIVKAIKVCVDWDNWWSMDFVSRRDCRTVFHGFAYRQVSIEGEYLQVQSKESTELPRVLLRRGGLVLFNPVDIVCRLYVMKLMKRDANISSSYYSLDMFTGAKTLYVLPGFEVKRYREFELAASRMSKQMNINMFRREHQLHHCYYCGAITVTGSLVANDHKISQRRLKSLKYALCSPRYLEYYSSMEASLKRAKHNMKPNHI